MKSNIIISGVGCFLFTVFLCSPYWIAAQPLSSYEAGGPLGEVAVADASEFSSGDLSIPMIIETDIGGAKGAKAMMEPTPLLFLCTGLIWLAGVRPLCRNWSTYRKSRILRKQVKESHEYQVSKQVFQSQPHITTALFTRE